MITKTSTFLKSRDGSFIIMTVIIFMVLFPFIFLSLQDITNIYIYSKQLKIALDAATKSACLAMKFDPDKLAQGIVEVTNISDVQQKFNDVFNANTSNIFNNSRLAYKGNFIKIYTSTTQAKIPNIGEIPSSITTQTIQVTVTKPSVFAIARYDYKTFLFGKSISIIAVSTSQHTIKGITP
ncbi:MAG: TadE/TadG family type IV pilus assembly protein [Thermovenabulum sp.]|uniref:TadE/TadG family type IV pilus assembly protein n=1 Tax=Thermovenabulum sp. TaxID=3100335 RepID=UPI003C7D46D0